MFYLPNFWMWKLAMSREKICRAFGMRIFVFAHSCCRTDMLISRKDFLFSIFISSVVPPSRPPSTVYAVVWFWAELFCSVQCISHVWCHITSVVMRSWLCTEPSSIFVWILVIIVGSCLLFWLMRTEHLVLVSWNLSGMDRDKWGWLSFRDFVQGSGRGEISL